jgi:protocatechuate 3,4-dioxygenase beta subunit
VTTDQDGNYRIEAQAGRYQVTPFVPSLITSKSKSHEDGKEVSVTEGQEIDKVDFDLIRGGVITGRVTDANGRPIIGEVISLSGEDDSPSSPPSVSSGPFNVFRTDDRGVYRIFGLPPGRYIVSAGQGAGGFNIPFLAAGRKNARTYHPGSTDRAKARVVEVAPGAEVTGVDIRLSPLAKGYDARGRVIDADTGKAISNAIVFYSAIKESAPNSNTPRGISPSNSKGEFHFDSLSPGHYSARAQLVEPESEYYNESIQFEVKSEDITGLEIKLRRGSSISGIVTIEDTDDPDVMSKVALLQLSASVEGGESDSFPAGFGSGKIERDGSFRIWGLRPGKAHIYVGDYLSRQKIVLARIERDGLEQPNSIEIKQGEQVTGVKLVLSAAVSSIRGQVVIEGGTLPPGTALIAYAENEDKVDFRSGNSATVDAAGYFQIDGLSPGSYRVRLVAELPGNNQPLQLSEVTESVIVARGRSAEVTLRLNLKKIKDK